MMHVLLAHSRCSERIFHSLIISQTNFPGALFYMCYVQFCIWVLCFISLLRTIYYLLCLSCHIHFPMGTDPNSPQSFLPMYSHTSLSVLIRTRLPLTYDYTPHLHPSFRTFDLFLPFSAYASHKSCSPWLSSGSSIVAVNYSHLDWFILPPVSIYRD